MEIVCDGCELPALLPANRLAWELFKIVANLGGGVTVDIVRLLELYGIRQPFFMLRKLGVIMAAARDNAERVKDGK